MRKVYKLSIDRRRLTTDPHLREEVATAIGDRLRAAPASGNSVGDVETTFKLVIMQTTVRVVPPQQRKVSERGWNGDAQSEAELRLAMTTRRISWKRQKANKQDSQPKRVVR